MEVKRRELFQLSNFFFKGFLFGIKDSDIESHVLNEFNKKGKEALKQLNGSFCGWLADEQKQLLYVFNDRLGMADLFLMQEGDNWLITDDYWLAVKELSEVSVNETAIEQLLQFGYMHWENTYLNEIKLCTPATIITIDLSGNAITSIEQYWHHKPQAVITNYSAAREQTTELIRNAVKECFVEPDATYAVANSGGLDSRWNLFFASQQKQNFLSYTYTGSDNSDATHISRKINETLGLSNTDYIQISTNDFIANYAGIHMSKTPMLPMYSTWYYDAHKRLSDLDININGFISTFLDAFTYMDGAENYAEFENKAITDKHEYCYSLYKPAVTELVNKVYKKQNSGRAKEAFMASLETLDMNDVGDICDTFDFYCRQRRLNKNEPWTDYYGQLKSRSPLCHNAIVDFSLALPFQMRDDRILYKDAAAEVMTSLQKVRFERSPWGLKGKEKGTAALVKDVLWRADMKLYKKTGHSFWFKGSHKNVAEWMCQSPNIDFIRNVINSENPLIEERFDQDYLNKHLEALIKKDFVFMSSLLTIFMFFNKLTDIK
ncbi:hypothetical protein [Carboxylicivirga sp. RSCT41]|uniref:hypothetical protein n=1 Tax=Carboxylicivirga agarovorans TaxID=3417570 RepID=UPI003D33F024